MQKRQPHSSGEPQESKPVQKRSTKETSELSEYIFGKVPPQALPLEEAVLGALLIDRDSLNIVTDLLSPEVFYHHTHQTIYRAIIRLNDRQNPVDILTVTEELRQMAELEKIGGSYYLVELTNRVASAANIEYHSRIIIQKHIQRQLIATGSKMVQEGYDETIDCFEAMDNSEKRLFAITQNTISRSTTEAGSIALSVYKEIADSANEGEIIGEPSGITEIDSLTGGWQKSDLIVIAARPGMGKTGLALTLTINAALNGGAVAFFSLEMSNSQLVKRMISILGSISGHKIRNRRLSADDLKIAAQTVDIIDRLPIYLDDTPGINVSELRAKCRRLKRQHDIKLVIVDYLQLMTFLPEGSVNKNSIREQEVAGISRALKGLAKELNVPVIALSQLSRAVETRGGAKRPQLSDLRESGAVEQDSDQVAFIYRPEYYGILEDEAGCSLKEVAEIIFAKNRHGDTDTVKVKFEKQFTRFSSLELQTDFFARPVANTLHNALEGQNNPANMDNGTAFPAERLGHNEIKPKSRNDEDIPF